MRRVYRSSGHFQDLLVIITEIDGLCRRFRLIEPRGKTNSHGFCDDNPVQTFMVLDMCLTGPSIDKTNSPSFRSFETYLILKGCNQKSLRNDGHVLECELLPYHGKISRC